LDAVVIPHLSIFYSSGQGVLSKIYRNQRRGKHKNKNILYYQSVFTEKRLAHSLLYQRKQAASEAPRKGNEKKNGPRTIPAKNSQESIMKTSIIFAALALILSLGAGTAAYAGHGQTEHANSSHHGIAEHSGGVFTHNQGQVPSFSQHGGGHEKAQNNDAIHQEEQKDAGHNDTAGHR
jgi:uncharacterized protein HemX